MMRSLSLINGMKEKVKSSKPPSLFDTVRSFKKKPSEDDTSEEPKKKMSKGRGFLKAIGAA